MKVNDGLKIISVTAMAVAVWAGTGSTDVSATTMGNAVITADDIQTSGADQKVYIDVSKLNKEEVMFGMATKGKKYDKVTFKVSAWDIFEINDNKEIPVAVDLSKLSNIKDNYVAIKTDGMEVPIIVKIPAVPKAATVTYNGAEQKLEFKVGAKKTEVKAASDYEWRTPYSSWNKPSDTEKLSDGVATKVFDDFKYQGATIYIRTPGAPKAAIKETEDASLKTAYDASNIDKEVKVYDAGSFPGKEAKLNIAKQANGPSVTAKYTSGTLTIPKSSEYRVVTIVDKVKTIPTELKKNESRADFTITKLLESAKQGILEVRTEQNTSRKKPASKWTRIPLSNLNELKVEGADGDIVNAKVTDSNNKPILTIGKTTDGVNIKNETSDSYQILVTDKEPEINTTQTTKLSGNGSYTIKNDNNNNGKNVYIRKVGDTKTKTWVSDYIKIGTVNLQ